MSLALAQRKAMIDVVKADFLHRHGLDGGRIDVASIEEAVVIHVGGLYFFERLDLSASDPRDAARAMDQQLSRLAQRARRKVQRTPRCYFPQEES